MAKCPKCGSNQKWLALIMLTRNSSIVCPKCNTALKYNQKRYSEIIGFFFILVLLPLTPFVDIEFSFLWVSAFIVPFIIAWITLIKLEKMDVVNLPITEAEESNFEIYAKKRRKIIIALVLTIFSLLSVWFIDAFFLKSVLTEYFIIFIIIAVVICITLLMVTRCPYCCKLVTSAPTCSNCKRKINIFSE